ncbi:hypothetical protein OOK31_17500 [Streptomyces sp. NBC_00249]|uniref:hypothetical protein n=1 Tax=Streptomyces sp. NBC_00249 TaxID=2975690 RepID=UPI00225B693E|nr:hypothetical protein [Streptomyces sp. NBC_00249]MCX5195679.1 hypothetical protein [Streptomyces sp. NBC_00249]
MYVAVETWTPKPVRFGVESSGRYSCSEQSDVMDELRSVEAVSAEQLALGAGAE